MRLAVAGYSQRRLEISARISVLGLFAVGIVILIIVRAFARIVADLEIAVLRSRTGKPVVNDYFVRLLVNTVNEHVVIVKTFLVIPRQRHFKIVRRVSVPVLQNGHRDPDFDLIALEVFKFAGHGVRDVEFERVIRIRVGRCPYVVAVLLLGSAGDYDAVDALDLYRRAVHPAVDNGSARRAVSPRCVGDGGVRCLRDDRGHHQDGDQKRKKSSYCCFFLHLSAFPIQ